MRKINSRKMHKEYKQVIWEEKNLMFNNNMKTCSLVIKMQIKPQDRIFHLSKWKNKIIKIDKWITTLHASDGNTELTAFLEMIQQSLKL